MSYQVVIAPAAERDLRRLPRRTRREFFDIHLPKIADVTYDDDFDFTRLEKRIFPWLGKNNVFEYKGKSDPLKVGQYFQYSLVELGLVLTRYLSKERKDKRGREWLSQKNVRAYWNKFKNQKLLKEKQTNARTTNEQSVTVPWRRYPYLR